MYTKLYERKEKFYKKIICLEWWNRGWNGHLFKNLFIY